jgi:hypothetical protein
MAKETSKVGNITLVKFGKEVRPFIVTSENKDGTVNGNVILEPGDNPTNDGNLKTHLRDVKV